MCATTAQHGKPWRAPGLHLFKASGLEGRAWIAGESVKAPDRGRPRAAHRGAECWTLEGSRPSTMMRRPSEERNAERGRPRRGPPRPLSLQGIYSRPFGHGISTVPRCCFRFLYKTRQYQVEHQWIVANILLSALTVPGFTQVVYKAFIISRFSNTLKHLLAKFTAGKHYSTPSQPWKW